LWRRLGDIDDSANGRLAPIAAIQGTSVLTDTVENVENRTAPKISRKLILSRLDRRNSPLR
jgi:hypothetical protein